MVHSYARLAILALIASLMTVAMPTANAQSNCDPAGLGISSELDRILNDAEFLQQSLPAIRAKTPVESLFGCSATTLPEDEQRRLLGLQIEVEKLDALITALKTAEPGEVSAVLEREFSDSRVMRALVKEARAESERLGEQIPGNSAVEIAKYLIAPDLVDIPDEYALAIGLVQIIAGQAGAPPVTAEGLALEVLTKKTLGGGIPGVLNPYGLAIFTGQQTWADTKKLAEALRGAAFSDLYQYLQIVLIDDKAGPVNDTGLETLLKDPAGKALIRAATGSNPPDPIQRGVGPFDYLFEDHFDEKEIKQWIRANALQIYTHINLYREAGGHYPLGLHNGLVERGQYGHELIGDVPKYSSSRWRQNVLMHHEQSRQKLEKQVEALRQKARPCTDRGQAKPSS